MKSQDIPRVISHATTQVKTAALSQKGIEQIRVLSESKFLHLVRKLVEDTVARRLADLESVPRSNGHEPQEIVVLEESLHSLDRDSREALPSKSEDVLGHRDRWNRLRQKHVEALEAIETRLASLGETVRDMEETLTQGTDVLPRERRRELRGQALRNRAENASTHSGAAGGETPESRVGRGRGDAT
jgi:hypothetical protein